MKKTIHRKVHFTPEDVRAALLRWMVDKDEPYPHGEIDSFSIGQAGVEMEWAEEFGGEVK